MVGPRRTEREAGVDFQYNLQHLGVQWSRQDTSNRVICLEPSAWSSVCRLSVRAHGDRQNRGSDVWPKNCAWLFAYLLLLGPSGCRRPVRGPQGSPFAHDILHFFLFQVLAAIKGLLRLCHHALSREYWNKRLDKLSWISCWAHCGTGIYSLHECGGFGNAFICASPA
jgi:hypothetical protein